MERRRSSRRRKKARRRRSLLKCIVLILFAVLVLYWGTQNVLDRILVKVDVAAYGRLEHTLDVDAIIIRDEVLVLSHIPGKVRRTAKDSQPVPSGTVVVEVTNDIVKQEIEPLRERIEKEIADNDMKKKMVLDELSKEVQSLNLQISSISEESERKSIEEKRARVMTEIEEKENYYIKTRKALADRLEEIERLGQIGMFSYSVDNASIVSYNYDGFEHYLSPSNLMNLEVADFKKVEDRSITIRDNMSVTVGDPVVRVIDRFKMMIAFLAPAEHMTLLRKETTVSVRLKDYNSDFYSISINDIIYTPGDDKIVVIGKFRNFIDGLTNRRLIPAEIIFRGYSGIILPSSAIISHRGGDGVYLFADGSRVAVPVTVRGEINGKVAVEGIREGAQVIINP